MIYRYTPLQPWNQDRPSENQMTSNGRFTTFTTLTTLATWAAATTTTTTPPTTPTPPVLKCTSKSNVFLPFTGPKISTWPVASWPTSANSCGSWTDVRQKIYRKKRPSSSDETYNNHVFTWDKTDPSRSIGPISKNFKTNNALQVNFKKQRKMAVFCMFLVKELLQILEIFSFFHRKYPGNKHFHFNGGTSNHVPPAAETKACNLLRSMPFSWCFSCSSQPNNCPKLILWYRCLYLWDFLDWEMMERNSVM